MSAKVPGNYHNLDVFRTDCTRILSIRFHTLSPLHFCSFILRKHAYSNILKIFSPKNENFEIKISDIFHMSSQTHRLWYSFARPCRGGLNEYQQSMFLSRNKKNDIYTCKPQFYYIRRKKITVFPLTRPTLFQTLYYCYQ